MASRPLRKAMLHHLATLATQHDLCSPDEQDHDTEQAATLYALHYLSGGHPPDRLPTVTNLAQYLTLHGTETSRPLLANWLTNEQTEQGKRRREDYYAYVKQGGAASLVDGALDKAETANVGNVGVAKLQVGVRQWIAERLDRSAWGQQAPQSVAIGALHLHAALPLVATPPLIAGSPPLDGSLDHDRVGGYQIATEPHQIASGVEVGTKPLGLTEGNGPA